MKLYLYVTDDEYEHPMYIADSQAELARMQGIRPASVNHVYHLLRTGKRKHSRYKEVEVDDEIVFESNQR